jgi:hypothetical protein
MKIMHTDNFGGDYPDEKFVEGLPSGLSREAMQRIANAINQETGLNWPRYYQVVPDDYQLQPGFEP